MSYTIKNKSLTRFAVVQTIYCIKSSQFSELDILNSSDEKNPEFLLGLDENIDKKKNR